MRLDMSLQQKLQLQLRLAPQIIQSIEILQLANIDLKDRIDLELAENEVLEVDDETTPATEVPPGPAAPAEATENGGGDGDGGEAAADPEFAETLERLGRMADEDRVYGLYRRSTESEEASDRKLEALQATEAPPPSLQDRLSGQLSLVEAPERVLKLAEAVVYSLDAEGFLPVHPLARPILEATAEDGTLQRPLEEIVDALAPARTEAAPESPAPEAAYGSYGGYGGYGGGSWSGGAPARRRRRDPEKAAAQQAARTKDREEAREELRREAARVALTAASLRRRLAREGRTATLEEGALLFPLVEILDLLAGEGFEAGLPEAEQALRLVQGLEPRGIGGRTAVETLLLQLDARDPSYEAKRRLVEHHLEDWRKNRLPRIAQAMGMSLEDLKELLEEMRDLRAGPGAALGSERSTYLNPDVVIEWGDEGWQVRLVNEYFPTLRVNTQYLRLLEDPSTDANLKEMIRKKIESARWLIDAIQQRQTTLLKVVREIVRHQQEWFDHGELTPLKMQRIADDLGIHVSTVSRAIAGKCAQTARGILPLKFFFNGATQGADGSVESRLSVKERVRKAIEAEDKRTPLSDEDLAGRFQAEGLNIARRTVTKYRKQLKIPSSRERRVWE